MVYRQRALNQARTLFTEQGIEPVGLLADPLLRSWRRCAKSGLDMRARQARDPLTDAELRQARQRNEDLRARAAAAMAALRGPGRLLILTDEQGLVLDCEGDTGFAEKAARVALLPGAHWGEEAAGTNAIGTALAEGRSLVVRGGEHYLEANRILTCSAVPIFDSLGRVRGVLDLSHPAAQASAESLAALRAAVARIERALFQAAHGDHEVLRLQAGDHEAWLAFDGPRLVGADRDARALLALDRSAIGALRYGDLFDGEPRDGQARTRQGRLLRLCDPLPAARRQSAVPAPPRSAPRPDRATGEPAGCFEAATLAALARAVHLSDAGVAVLLQGETGTGKEVFARALHARSARAGGPFVAVNCAALPESLIEAELFGYEEGAFTGARRQGSKGLLRQAQGGTLFLDEIGDMPLPLQARLLRVLQSREVAPLGAGRPVAVDFALVCATHRPLARGPGQAPLRDDLYYRIAEYTVALPPLREHHDRLALLRRMWGEGEALPPAIEAELAAYDWPGNYRQLDAVLRTLRVLARASGGIERDMLPAEIRQAAPPGPALREQADAAIEAALRAHGGNVSRAARALGVHRSTLYRRRVH